MLRQIPNLFTLLNLVLGSVAVILILQTEDHLPENMVLGAALIYCAAIIDFLDGFIARWMNAASEMGKQLDSLSDAVSFGLAPSLIVYQLLRLSYMQSSNGMATSFWLLLPALFIACCAVWRLAKFNVDQRQSVSFRGVPTPITALMFASFPLILWFEQGGAAALLLQKVVLYGLTLVAGLLMISDIPMMSLKWSGGSMKKYLPQLMLLVFSVVLILFLHWLAIPLIYIAYVLLSLFARRKILSQ
ncbi:MAG: CDP-diacylglycerol--serine O-phosphatidyltransferase [Bacteroidetes bacterium]|nr:CDP-diacylglycerol--serine O-phosphatidyltransferase [Bacteroidota bacterium]